MILTNHKDSNNTVIQCGQDNNHFAYMTLDINHTLSQNTPCTVSLSISNWKRIKSPFIWTLSNIFYYLIGRSDFRVSQIELTPDQAMSIKDGLASYLREIDIYNRVEGND